MATVFKKNNKGPYLIRYFDHTGQRREKSSRTTDKRTAERLADKLEADTMLRREGIIDARTDRYAEADRKALTVHLADFVIELTARGNTSGHVSKTEACVKRIIDARNLARPADIAPSSVQSWIGEHRKAGKSPRSANEYLRAIKSFSRWLVRDGRMAHDALEHLSMTNEATDRRLIRRDLTDLELTLLIAAAATFWAFVEKIGRCSIALRPEPDSGRASWRH